MLQACHLDLCREGLCLLKKVVCLGAKAFDTFCQACQTRPNNSNQVCHAPFSPLSESRCNFPPPGRRGRVIGPGSPGRGRFPEPPQTRRLLSSHLLLCEKFERKCKATKRLASTRTAGSAWFAFIAGSGRTLSCALPSLAGALTVADLGAPLRSLAPGPASRHGFGLCPGDADRPAGSDLDMSCCLCLPAARPARKQ